MIIRLRSHTHSFRCENRPLVCKNELKCKKLGTLNFNSYLCPRITNNIKQQRYEEKTIYDDVLLADDYFSRVQ